MLGEKDPWMDDTYWEEEWSFGPYPAVSYKTYVRRGMRELGSFLASHAEAPSPEL